MPQIELERVLDGVQRVLITEALRATGWNAEHASKLLGVDRANLLRRMRRLDIVRPCGECAKR